MKKTLWQKLPLWLKILAAVFAFLLILYFSVKLIPDKTLKSFENKQNSTRFYDRNGKLIYVLPLENGLRREYVSIDELPAELVNKFIEEEDKNFYHHAGVDFISIARALIQNRKSGRIVSGASTITMQLVRIIWPRKNGVNAGVKIKEAFKAFYLEIKYSKKEILELYLNNVPFGYQIEGVASASRSFFGTEVNYLSEMQQEILAKIPRRPAEYAPDKSYTYENLCPHFMNYVVESYRKSGTVIPDKVELSIDSGLVELSEKLIQMKLREYEEARIHNGSAFAINNHTGEIILWTGNASFEDEEHSGQIDGVLVANQPGSSMKPFLYALGLEDKFSPNSVLPDIPMDFGGEKVYVPLNFNNHYNGPVRYRVALASSLNVPAVYVLYNEGMDRYFAELEKLGFESLRDQRQSTGLSLALGSDEVTLYEMVQAFSVFVNDGKRIPVVFESKGASSKKSQSVECYKADTARIMCSILSDKNSRSLGFGHAQVFDTPYDSIFKTGTSNQFQNIIALGATKDFTVGVWMGNFEGETVVGKTGSSLPAAIVRNLLDELVDTYGTPAEFSEPVNYVLENICSLSGMKAGKDCPSVSKEYISKDLLETFNANVCSWHYRQNGRVQIRYPSEYQHWGRVKNFSGSFYSDVPLEINYPGNHAAFIYDPTVPEYAQQLTVEAFGGSEPTAELYVDGHYAGTASTYFYWQIPLTKGVHHLTVNCGEETQSVEYTVQ